MKSWELLKEEENRDNYKCYELDYDESNRIVISQQNVLKVNAMIRSNSSYRNSANEKAYPKLKKGKDPEDNYKDGNYYECKDDEIKSIISSDNKNFNYPGSSAFWFSKLKSFIKDDRFDTTDKSIYFGNNKTYNLSFGYVLYKTVCAVDSENSTHLSADGIGRALIAKRLFDIASNDLINKLKNPDYTIIKQLSSNEVKKSNGFTNEEEKGNNKKPRYNLSFSTKWCHYACMYMFDTEEQYRDNFAIVDGVVKSALKKYKGVSSDKKLDFNILNDNKSIGDNYQGFIDIVDAVRKSGDCEITRNGLDHLLWYSNKGLSSGDDEE